ncbi:hypothetical protein [Nonomuraea sediminis]|uniref:hypothetical protein n=1 Tax=Nonomuraea sediminis TaxID=2835864 RepID=UPI001BDD5615|nr:hypothetical protein [Nonomuraea sediminis]
MIIRKSCPWSTQQAIKEAKNLPEKIDWTMRHFAQANPEGSGQGDVPSLLRRVADSIEALGDVEVHDLIMHTEITTEGSRPSITVYFAYLDEST